MTPERLTQNAILREFGTRPDLRIWRSNVGAARFRGQVVRFGVPGQADLTGILPVRQFCTCPRCEAVFAAPPIGRRLEIEVKSPTGQQNADQKNYQAMVKRFGGLYVLARDPVDVARAIAEAGHA